MNRRFLRVCAPLAHAAYPAASKAASDGSAVGETSQRQVAAEEMNTLIEDALVTALGGGGKGVVDADLARQCLVALIDLQMARSDVVQVLLVTPPCGICSLC